MKTKTSFKHMYLVDNNLYNKLSLNSKLNIENNLDFNTDKQSLSLPKNTSSAQIINKLHPQNIAINPNIHIHNKHAPSSSSLSHLTYTDTPPPPPHAPPPQQPHVSENHSSLTHAQVGIHNTNHNVSTNTNTNHNVSTNTNTNANIGNNLNFNTDKQSLSLPKNPEIKESDGIYMDYNNLVEND